MLALGGRDCASHPMVVHDYLGAVVVDELVVDELVVDEPGVDEVPGLVVVVVVTGTSGLGLPKKAKKSRSPGWRYRSPPCDIESSSLVPTIGDVVLLGSACAYV